MATETSDVFELTVDNFHKLIKISESFFQLGRIFQYGVTDQDYRLKKSTPKEKYVELLARRPDLIHRFPLKYIASYLDITPETLSRVRKSLS